MNSDQKCQEKYKYLATVQSGKLLLQINDNITYKGEVESSPYFDILELKAIFERGDLQILTKTTSKLVVKLAILKIEMFSEESRQIQALKAKVEELEKLFKLEGPWEEQDLDSKTNFDLNYTYKIHMPANNLNSVCIAVTPTNLYFFNGGSNSAIAASNKRASNGGHTIAKIQKKKI